MNYIISFNKVKVNQDSRACVKQGGSLYTVSSMGRVGNSAAAEAIAFGPT